MKYKIRNFEHNLIDISIPEEILNLSESRNLVFDLGCGEGEFILNLAKKDSSSHFIGIEIKYGRVLKCLKSLEKLNLKNINFILGDATLIISQFIREGSAKRFYINNPDPWPKDKHEKNRIINFGFLDHIFNLLSRKGDLVIKSDDLKYIEYIRTEISKSKFKTTFDYNEKLPPTKFQTSYAKKRVPIHTIYSRKN